MRLAALCALLFATVIPARADTSVIDLMFVYTPAARVWADANTGGIANAINNALAVTQATLDNSDIAITVNLVHSAELSYVESGDALTDMTRLSVAPDYNPHGLQFDGYLDEIHQWRVTYGADLVVLLIDDGGNGGMADFPDNRRGNPNQAFSLVAIRGANSYVTPHELGHNFGCHHSRNQTDPAPPEGGLYEYSTGWRWFGTDSVGYVSTMTYWTDPLGFDTYVVVPIFSNPNITHLGAPTGSYDTMHPVTGIYAPADNARSINNIRTRVAAYRTASGTPEQPVVIHHDSVFRGTTNGFGSPGSVATRLDTTDLTGRAGAHIVGVRLLANWTTESPPNVNVRIWRGGSVATGPGTLVTDISITDSIWDNSWTEITLPDSVAIEGDTEYWVGYYADSTTWFWFGRDEGPLISNKGGWYNSGGGWAQTGDNRNWSIRVVLDDFVDSNPPLPFSLSAPAANHDTNTTTMTFSWNLTTDTGSGVKEYRLQADTYGGSFASPIAETTVGAAVSAAALTLPANDTYRWRVVARDTAGNSQYSSETRTIRVDTAPPTATSNVAPADLTDTSTTAIVFSWTASTDTGAGLRRYRLQIDTSTAFAVPLVDSAMPFQSTSASRTLPANDTYWWRVVAEDSAGNSCTSSYWQLRVDTAPPGVPALMLPADATETRAAAFTFSWSAVTDSLSGLQGYRLQIDTAGTFTNLLVDSATSATSLMETLPANDTYRWRVVARDTAGNQSTSANNTLRIDTLAAATLSSPASGSVRDSRPAFSWTGTSAETYVIQVATDSAFGTIRDSSTTTATTWTPSGLDSGSYFWRVGASDRLGNYDTSAVWTIRIDTGLQDTTAPQAFSLTAPANNTETRATTLTFRWGTAIDSTAVGYRLQVCTSTTFVVLAVDTYWLTETYVTVTLPANDTYYWRVWARDNFNNERQSTETWLVVVDTAGPSVPVIVAPKNGDTRITGSPVLLDWSASTDSLSGVNRYRLQIDTAGTFTGNLAADSYQAGVDTTLAFTVDTYFWRVVAYDDAGCTTPSTTESFVVIVPPDTTAPAAFSLTAPQDGTETSVTVIAFRWNAAADSHAVTYRLLADNDPTFGSPTLDTSWLSATSCTASVPANDTYYWKVAARDTSLNLKWSTETFVLVVDTAGPSAPTIVAPKNGDTRTSPVLLDWDASTDTGSGLNRYRVQIDTAGTFAGSLVADSYQTVLDTTLSLAIDTYYWRVIAYDDVGNTTAVAPESFRITVPAETVPPSAFSLASPISGLETTSVTIAFRWGTATDSTGPVTYRLQVSTSATFGVLAFDTSWLSAAACTTALPASSRYYWRVWARDALGNLRQSTETWTLVVDTAGPGVPALTLHGGAGETSPIVFQWSAVTDSLVAFRNYRLQVSNTQAFSSYAIDSYTTSTETTAMLQIDTYWWRVVAYDTLGNSTTSATDSLVVVSFSESNPPVIYFAGVSPASATNSGVDTIVFSVLARDSSAIASVVLKRSTFCDTATLANVSDSLYRVTVTVDSSLSATSYACVLRVTDAFGNYSETTVTVTVTNATPSFATVTNFGADSVAVYGNYVSARFDTTVVVSQVQYEYRSHTAGGAWTPCAVASISPANPSSSGIVWDLQALPADVYELRSVGRKPSGETDAHAAIVLVNRLVGAAGATVLTSYASGVYSETHIFRGGTADTRALFDGTRIATPAGAFADSAYICLTRYTSAPPEAPAPAGGLLVPGSGAYRRFDRAGGAAFGANVIVALPFSDSGITSAQKNALALYTYDEVARRWTPVSGSVVDTSNNVVRAAVGHFSYFAIFVAGNATNLQGVSLYPNPFVPYDGNADNGIPYSAGNANSGVMFTNLPANVDVDVYTVSGARVVTLHTNAAGTWQWDVRGEDNRELASGVYLVVFRSGGETVVKKLMVIR